MSAAPSGERYLARQGRAGGWVRRRGKRIQSARILRKGRLMREGLYKDGQHVMGGIVWQGQEPRSVRAEDFLASERRLFLEVDP